MPSDCTGRYPTASIFLVMCSFFYGHDPVLSKVWFLSVDGVYFSFSDEVLYSGLYHVRFQYGLGLYVFVVPGPEVGRHQLTVRGKVK